MCYIHHTVTYKPGQALLGGQKGAENEGREYVHIYRVYREPESRSREISRHSGDNNRGQQRENNHMDQFRREKANPYNGNMRRNNKKQVRAVCTGSGIRAHDKAKQDFYLYNIRLCHRGISKQMDR